MPSNYLLLLLFCFLSSCASQEIRQVDLHDKYDQLSMALKDHIVRDQRQLFYSAEYLKQVKPGNVPSLELLTLPNYIHKEASYYQKVKSKQGCVTVNGFEKSGDPVSLFLQYKDEHNDWLVNDIWVKLDNSKRNFAHNAVCPVTFEHIG